MNTYSLIAVFGTISFVISLILLIATLSVLIWGYTKTRHRAWIILALSVGIEIFSSVSSTVLNIGYGSGLDSMSYISEAVIFYGKED